MSILAAVPATDESSTFVQTLFAFGLVATGLFVARLLGVFRSRSVSGPRRLQADTSLAGVIAVLMIGFIVWFGTQIIYLSLIRSRLPANADGAINVASLPPADMAILATLPFLVGLIVLMLGDALVKTTLPHEMGWSPRVLLRGAGQGLLAMLCVLPLMFVAGIVLELFYQLIGYRHPTEHEMLTVLGRSRERMTTYLIIGGATLLAPVFEEFLFRGHLQTILVSAFSPRRNEPQGFPVLDDAMQPLEAPMSAGSEPRAYVTMPPAVALEAPALWPGARWAAIAITSLLFAALHPGWTWPLIFLLSLALGYAYERTGNLWVPVVMHLVFNTFNTALFLLTRTV